jgi:hypothetical protein
MDKFKGLAKGGWHPPGDPSVSRATWKQDLKGLATGKKHDPNEEKRNHESKPLASLRDRESMQHRRLCDLADRRQKPLLLDLLRSIPHTTDRTVPLRLPVAQIQDHQ